MGDFDNCGCDDSKIGKMGKTFSYKITIKYIQFKVPI